MKKYKAIFAITFLSLFIISIFNISIALAQEFQAQVPFSDTFKNKITFGEGGTIYIGQYVRDLYQYGLSIGAILATVVLMAAGVVWLTSGGNQSQVGKAKEMITGSLVGLFLLFGSWFILNTINPALVDLRTRGIDKIDELEYSYNLGCCETSSRAFITYESNCNGDFYDDPFIWPNENNYNGNPPETKCIEIFGCCQITSVSGVTGIERKSCYILETENQRCRGHSGPGGSSVKFKDAICGSDGICIRDGGGGVGSGGGGAN